MRLLLGQLRHNQDAGPQPLLADLDPLVDRLRASGLAVVLEHSGTPQALASAKQLAIYRIVQEALTNALRHSPAGEQVVVSIAWTPDAAEVTIANPLPAPATDPQPGHGLAGMRERALLVGGKFSAAPTRGQFVVHAVIPVSP